MKKLILAYGNARVGKDSFANFFCQDIDSVQQLDMTRRLKEMVAIMIGRSPKFVDENKDMDLGAAMGHGKIGFTIRHMLQIAGNDWLIPIGGKYVLCQEVQERMFSVDREFNVLTGIRSLKEVDFFKKVNPDKEVIALKIERLNEDGSQYVGIDKKDTAHITETEVSLIESDYTISAKNLDELEEQTREFIASI